MAKSVGPVPDHSIIVQDGVDGGLRLTCGCPRSTSSVSGLFELRFGIHLPTCSLATHEHPEARVVLPLHGVFTSRHGLRSLTVQRGEALYRPSGQAHSDRYDSAVACVVLLVPTNGELPVVPEAFVARSPGLAEVAAALVDEMNSGDSASPLVREGLAVMAATLVFQHRELTDRGTPAWLRLVQERIAEPGSVAPSLSELARVVDRDPAHVAATFKRVYGQSVGITLRRLRLNEARNCLKRDQDRSLSEIALSFGFADQSHFTRHFKRVFGITPGQYRQRQRTQRIQQVFYGL